MNPGFDLCIRRVTNGYVVSKYNLESKFSFGEEYVFNSIHDMNAWIVEYFKQEQK